MICFIYVVGDLMDFLVLLLFVFDYEWMIGLCYWLFSLCRVVWGFYCLGKWWIWIIYFLCYIICCFWVWCEVFVSVLCFLIWCVFMWCFFIWLCCGCIGRRSDIIFCSRVVCWGCLFNFCVVGSGMLCGKVDRCGL